MQKFLLTLGCLLFAVPVMAQGVSYEDFSKYLLDNEVLRSPVYTKRVYRSIREFDQDAYQDRAAQLEKQKEDRVISNQEYNKEKERLDSAYNDAYSKQDQAKLGQAISEYPAAAFYSSLQVSPDRMRLLKQSALVTTEPSQDQSASLDKAVTLSTDTVNPRTMIQQNRRVIPRAPDMQGNGRLDTSIKSISIRSLERPRKKLGEKSIPINISTFK